jgi:hypothetical protein
LIGAVFSKLYMAFRRRKKLLWTTWLTLIWVEKIWHFSRFGHFKNFITQKRLYFSHIIAVAFFLLEFA